MGYEVSDKVWGIRYGNQVRGSRYGGGAGMGYEVSDMGIRYGVSGMCQCECMGVLRPPHTPEPC